MRPELQTERLSLRIHGRGDLDDSAAMWSDPSVTRFIGGRVFTTEQCWSRLLRYVGHWSVLGFGYWVVRDRASGRFVGEVGFANFKRHVTPSLGDAPEAGWVLAPWAHGKGFATEAVRAAHEWLATRKAPASLRTVCMIDPENAASIRVAEKCGYREWTRTEYEGGPALLMERT